MALFEPLSGIPFSFFSTCTLLYRSKNHVCRISVRKANWNLLKVLFRLRAKMLRKKALLNP